MVLTKSERRDAAMKVNEAIAVLRDAKKDIFDSPRPLTSTTKAMEEVNAIMEDVIGQLVDDIID